MAISYPTNPDFVNKSEKKVYEILNGLNDSWHIYSNIRQHITLFEKVSRGEVDFILTHPYLGIILLEVKGFGIFSKNGNWYRTETVSGEGERTKLIKSPYMQIENARGNLQDFLYENKELLQPIIKNSADFKKISIHTLVVFPFLPDFKNLGMESEKNNTVTQKDLENIEKYLKDCIPKSNFNDLKGIQDKLKELIIPDINTVPMKGLTRDLQKQLMSSTEEQSIILNSILDNNSNIFVTGPAGSGKTVLAVEAARNAAENDEKVLFLCYNQNLGKYLKNLLEDYANIEVYSLFSFFSKININLKDAGTSHLSPVEAAPIIADLFSENFDKFSNDFNTLIIDEAQDFSPLFWPTFELLTEKKKWFIFADKKQAITHDDWHLPQLNDGSWLKFPLTKYLRSTKEISEKVLNVFNLDQLPTSISGIEPEFLLSNGEWNESLTVLSNVIEKLFEEENYDQSQVQILIPHSRYLDEVEQTKYLENKKLGGIANINIESIYKFKGLESEVVVIIAPNIESLKSENTSDIKSLMYVGMSRATTALTVIGNQEIKELTNWDQ